MSAHEVSALRCFSAWIMWFMLLIMFFYHFTVSLTFRKMSYDITRKSLIIRSFPYDVELSFSEIKCIKAVDELLTLKKKLRKFKTYGKESPQVIHYIGQLGMFQSNEFDNIILYSTLSSWKKPTGLILIKLKNEKTYGISPENPEQFVEDLEKKLNEYRSHS
jgi:hypothetical protein